MKFNRYILDLYLAGEKGKVGSQIWAGFLDWENWEKLDLGCLAEQINSSLYLNPHSKDDLKNDLEVVKQEILEPLFEVTNEADEQSGWLEYKEKITNKFGFTADQELVSDARICWDQWLKEIISEHEDSGQVRDSVESVRLLSIFLSVLNPHFFFPYFFISQFWLIEKLFSEFDLILPALPKTRDYKARLNYYFELCEVIYYFRQENKIKPEEFFAFLYGFVGNIIKEDLDNNEKPLRVWLALGSPNDLSNIQNQIGKNMIWAGNLNALPGDIQLIYFWGNSKSIKAVSKVVTNGFFDPFDFFERKCIIQVLGYLENGITFKDFKENEIWRNKGLVKTNMQASAVASISHDEYQELRNILTQKGENPSILPDLERIAIEVDQELQNERDVEEKLLEPLLLKLGFETKDWIRQLSVRMGRGERNYPDYALNVNKSLKGEETAKFLWEAKYRISNQKQLRDSFFQAKSYARRLDSKAFGLVSVEGFWLSDLKDKFEFERLKFFSWEDLNKSEKWQQVKSIFR